MKAKPRLLNTFDSNADGQLGIDEWQAVRGAAEHWVAEETRVTQAVKPYHVMQDGKNQALFLIANIPLQELAVTYQQSIFL